jgi:hypothetical protein
MTPRTARAIAKDLRDTSHVLESGTEVSRESLIALAARLAFALHRVLEATTA